MSNSCEVHPWCPFNYWLRCCLLLIGSSPAPGPKNACGSNHFSILWKSLFRSMMCNSGKSPFWFQTKSLRFNSNSTLEHTSVIQFHHVILAFDAIPIPIPLTLEIPRIRFQFQLRNWNWTSLIPVPAIFCVVQSTRDFKYLQLTITGNIWPYFPGQMLD